MATNYEILKNLSRKQMEAFIRSLVNKEVSRYIDWASWLGSENPEPPYIGVPAFNKKDGDEKECRLLEESEENGIRYRTIFTVLEKGEVLKETLDAQLVRKADEVIYPAAPLADISLDAIDEVNDESDLIIDAILAETDAEEKALNDMITESISERAVTTVIPVIKDEQAAEQLLKEAEETASDEEEGDLELPKPDIFEEDDLSGKISLDDIIQSSRGKDDLTRPENKEEAEVWKELEEAVIAADRAEDEVTSSLKFDDLWSLSGPEFKTSKTPAETAAEPEPHEEPAQEVSAAEEDEDDENAFFRKGRIELLKESLFDDEDEVPESDLVFMETTAIEIPKNGIQPEAAQIPEAAEIPGPAKASEPETVSEPEEEPAIDDVNPEFAEFEIPEDVFEAANRAEATSSIELDPEEDADSFFERLKALSEESEADEDSPDASGDDQSEEKEEEEKPAREPAEETIGLRSVELKRFLSDIKKESMLFDPDDPEDQELPTIAFSSMVSEKDKMF